jgi:spermidine/putrescine transport system substrate-binding protein
MSDKFDLPPELLQAARSMSGSLSRRGFLRGTAASGAVIAGADLLAACGTPAAKAPSSEQSAADHSDADKVANFSNWPSYIDIDDKVATDHPTLDAFKKETGVTVNYVEDINDNQTFYAKIQPQLSKGQDTGRDLIVMTDWMAARLVQQNYVQKIDHANTPNLPGNIVAGPLHAPQWDPQREYSAPWQAGLTGICYDAKKTEPVRSLTDLLTRSDLKGKIAVLTEMRDTMGLIMLDQGKDPSNFTDDDFNAAIAVLQKAKDSGQIRAFTGNEYIQSLKKGDLTACLAWSGDVIAMQADSPEMTWSPPEAGVMQWADNMLIPNQCQHKKNAELLMNYYYDPKVAAQLAAYVNYICPVAGAQEAMQALDPELAKNSLIFPTDADRANFHSFKALTEAETAKYEKLFAQVTGG